MRARAAHPRAVPFSLSPLGPGRKPGPTSMVEGPTSRTRNCPWIHTHNSAAPRVSVLWRSACPTVSRKRSGARGTSIVDSSSISFFFRCPSAGDFATGRRDQFRRDWPPGMSVLIETSLGDMVFDLHTDLCPKVRPTALGVAVPSAPSAAPLRVS